MQQRIRIALASAVVAALAACSSTPTGMTISDTITASARVEAVDLANRAVMLRTAEGRGAVVAVGPEVRNLEQVKPGDIVTVAYQEALLADVVKPGTGRNEVTAAAARAPVGERPAGAAGAEVVATVRIYEVDTVANVVEFTGPRGYNRRVQVRDPSARAFIRGLKPGDQVELRWREAIAVRVDPVR